MKIGEKIKQVRLTANLNQAAVAAYLNVDQSLISKIEKGEREISTDMLKKLSDLFCCPMAELLDLQSDDGGIVCAFRTNGLTIDDLNIIAAINRIALNVESMDELMGGNHEIRH